MLEILRKDLPMFTIYILLWNGYYLTSRPGYKVDNPYLITFRNWSSLFEWYVLRCGSKNGYPKDICLKELDCMLKI